MAATLLSGLAPPAFAQAADGWEFSVTPYVSFVSLGGDVRTREGEGVDISSSFDDVFDSLSGGFLGKAEARYDRMGGFVDFQYLKLSGDNTAVFNGVPRLNSEIELEASAFTAALYYRAISNETTTVDLVAGVRRNSAEVEIDLARAGFPGVSGSIDQEYWDPIVGVRASTRMAERWSVTGYADVGGGGDSELVWQVLGTVNYHAADHWTLHGGYRYYALEVGEDVRELEFHMHGPIVGATYRF